MIKEPGDTKHPQLEYESKVYKHLEGASLIIRWNSKSNVLR